MKYNYTPENSVKLSIVTICYNQEKYIAQTLDGFLSQKTDFDFEIIIADDCSTDNTQKIITSYAKRFPDIIKPILREENIGVQLNMWHTLRMARGEYIALCEGDDYWTDPLKLQKQVDYMDTNQDCALCFHPVRVIYEDHEKADSIFPISHNKDDFTFESLLRLNYIQTNSVVYRRQNYESIANDVMPADWYMHIFHSQFGVIGYIDEVMSVYRRHHDGIWWKDDNNKIEFWQKNALVHMKFYTRIYELVGSNEIHRKIIRDSVNNFIDVIMVDCADSDHLVLSGSPYTRHTVYSKKGSIINLNKEN